jgi:DNA-binding MarR family transcriptional regulator
MIESRPQRDAVARVLTASRALVGVAARSMEAAESKVTLQQYRALVLLAGRGPQNVSTLADALGIHPSTATRLCDRLLERELIERAPAADNRREVILQLDRAGSKLLREVTRRRTSEIRRIIARLDADVLEQLIAAFDAFADAAGEARDDAWRLGWSE